MADVREIYLNALRRHSPDLLVKKALNRYVNFTGEQPLYVVGAGKASVKMARGMLELMGDGISKGLIVAPKTEGISLSDAFQVHVGSHPIPDENSAKAGQALLEFIRSVPPNGIVITLISGGTSSLTVQPAEGLSVGNIREVYERLVNSGADIYEINAVRKHLSKIKGGQLLRYLNPKVQLIDLIISDVPGDDPAIIGSGLTIPDPSTFVSAKSILKKYDLWDKLPESARRHIKRGVEKAVDETIKPGEDPILDHNSYIIGSAKLLADAISEEFESLGYESAVAKEAYNDEVGKMASEIAREAVSKAEEKNNSKPRVLIYYGESTVQVTGTGKGGRNQELALRGALEIAGYANITWLSVGTDGIDGPTDAAGAMINGDTISKARAKGINPASYLENNDSYHFHDQLNTLFKTGPTGNNLMDLQIVVIE
ncbi:MAG: DUF4147 domain-containing protein [Balneolaceae bacterium]|nr:DUF4147 domain-containing protein [Balneolaceae bacterium]